MSYTAYARIATVKDILYCDESCSKEAYDKILDMWSGKKIEEVEKSHAISAFKSIEVTLLNRLFGSSATCIDIPDVETQKLLLKLMPNDLYKNFRRATFKREMDITVEDWLWELNEKDFIDELDIELTCLENAIVSLLLYLLGGFKIPRDDLKIKMDDWIKVDVHELFNRPRELFLLTKLSPAVLSRYVYLKCTSILMALMRLYAKKKVSRVDIKNLINQLEYNGYVTDDKSR